MWLWWDNPTTPAHVKQKDKGCYGFRPSAGSGYENPPRHFLLFTSFHSAPSTSFTAFQVGRLRFERINQITIFLRLAEQAKGRKMDPGPKKLRCLPKTMPLHFHSAMSLMRRLRPSTSLYFFHFFALSTRNFLLLSLTERGGFEPPFSDSKSDILPLDDLPLGETVVNNAVF